MIKCKKCKLEFGNKGSYIRHSNDCKLSESIIKSIIEDYSLKNLTIRNIRRKYGMTYLKLRSLLRFYKIPMRDLSSALKISNKTSRPHTEESKRKISESRKIYLKSNPDKHPWKSNDKFLSVPCEKLKLILNEMGVNYVPEFPVEGRNFSIDIAIPDKKIAIEINGNQHYNSDGTLKEYYQERNKYLSDAGWYVHELHYSIPYSKSINNIIENIISSRESIYDFDYEKYLRGRINKVVKNKCSCGKFILKNSKTCRKCANPSTKIPDKLILQKDISDLGYSGTGRKYGVSPTTVKRWEKKFVTPAGLEPATNSLDIPL
jgi:hypothetical protein